MKVHLRDARSEDLPAASALCLRSKAYWKYDAAFLEACRAELTLRARDLFDDRLVIASVQGRMAGVAQVSCGDDGCYLEKLFVDPDHMGKGLGRKLFNWSLSAALEFGAKEMIIEADPQAEAFYRRMGCQPAGSAKSGSIPGRILPRLKIAISGTQP